MILISLLIVLALEFHFKIGSQYRDFKWFEKARNFLAEVFSSRSFFDSWGGICVILLSPVLILYGFVSIFDGIIYSLVLLVVSIVVLFLTLGPISLEKTFENYFESMDRDDLEGAYLHLKQDDVELGAVADTDIEPEEQNPDTPENDELVRNATRKILVESQKRYFGVIAWFIFLGPLGALFYRLSHIYRDACLTSEFDEHLPLMDSVIHWVDWVPARITSLLFLLTGDFVKGFYRIKDYLYDADANNDQLISDTGIAALGLEMGVSTGGVDENHSSIELVHRTVIIYLVIAAVMTTIS